VTLYPAVNPVTVVVGELTFVMEAPFANPTTDQVPVPTSGAFAPRVKVELLQCSSSGPAVATVALALFVRTSSSELEHDPFVIVQRSVTLLPIVRPVTVLVREEGEVIVALFADPTILHKPVPVTGAFALSVKLPVLQSS
jgi:hypothetical protein